jgi:hypothetical protein
MAAMPSSPPYRFRINVMTKCPFKTGDLIQYTESFFDGVSGQTTHNGYYSEIHVVLEIFVDPYKKRFVMNTFNIDRNKYWKNISAFSVFSLLVSGDL